MNRRDFIAAGLASAMVPGAALRARHAMIARPRPTSSQLDWQRDELAMFLHFGVNTFTDREWGDGREDPRIFDPRQLDARTWARTAGAAGFRAVILTAKHHDGFCLWPTRTTEHSVAKSPWRGGQGDVVRELVDACHAESLKIGLYLSPWDRNSPVYGDSPRYNDLYIEQLTELLTRYGNIAEVWFDGANGEGPSGRRQAYDWPRVWSTVRRLQPDAVIFSDAGPDVRWIGNERGVAGDTNWSTVDPAVVPFPGATGSAVMSMLQRGDPTGTAWRPGETDVSIRPGWFYHAAEDSRVKTVDELVGLYFTSVGRNSKLLLNVPPTPDGLLHAVDTARLSAMRATLDAMFATKHAAGHPMSWNPSSERDATGEVDLQQAKRVAIVDLREDIAQGQVVERYTVEYEREGSWLPIAGGTTIGYRKLDRVDPVEARRFRVVVRTVADAARPVSIGLYGS